MSVQVVYETFKQPIDLAGDGSVMLTAIGRIDPQSAWHAEAKLYERHDLFAKSFRTLPKDSDHSTLLEPTVFIQDSVERQHGGKIAAFVRRINEMVNDAHEMARDIQKLSIVPSNWTAKTYIPTITVSLECNDMNLGQKSQKIISALTSAIESGTTVKFINKCNENSPWTQVVNSMIANQNQR